MPARYDAVLVPTPLIVILGPGLAHKLSFAILSTIATLAVFSLGSSLAGSQGQSGVATISAANFKPTVAPDSIVACFGSQLATGVKVADTVPLPTSLLGTTLTIRDASGASLPAPLLFVSPGQINYIVPAQARAGAGTVVVRSGDGQMSEGPIDIASVAPGIFTANQDGAGVPSADVLHVTASGSQSSETPYVLGEDERFIPKSIDLGPSSDRVFLILYLTGLRGTPSTDGNADNGSAENVTVLIGGVAQTPLYAGRQSFFAGLDQINLEIPRTLLDSSLPGSKQLDISVKVSGYNDSNHVVIALAPPAGAPALQITGVVAPTRPLANSTILLNGVGISSFVDKNRISFGEGTGDPLAGEVRTASTTQISAVLPFGVQSGSIALNSDGRRWTSASPISVRTSFSAVIKDTDGQLLPPIAGARVCFPDCTSQGALTTTLQAGGWFVLPDPPVGTRRVFVIEPAAQNAVFPFNRTLIASPITGERDNHLPQDVFLQAIYGPSGMVGGPTGLTSALRAGIEAEAAAPALSLSIAGFSFTVAAGTESTFPGGANSGVLTLTPVKNSLTPVPLPQGVFSSAIVQISPFGVKLNPGGKLVFPNLDHLPASRQPILYKYDLNNASFQDTGVKGTISDDGRFIETPAGAIAETSIYLFGLPASTTTIAGRVLDSDGVTPVRAVVVRAKGRQAMTDGNGGFSLPEVPASERIPVTASYLRPTGRTDTASGETGPPVVGGITNLAALTLSGSSSNRPPSIFAPGVITLYATESNETAILAVDQDTGQSVDGLTASGAGFSAVQTLGGGSFALRLTPKTSDVGTYDLILEARDSAGAVAAVTVDVIVLPLPVASALAVVTQEDTPAPITLSGTDAGSATLTFNILTLPLHGTLSGTAPVLFYNPARDFNGTDSFTFSVSNGKVTSTPATVSIKIDAVNDAPQITFGCVQTSPFLVGQTINCSATASDIEESTGLVLSVEGLPDGAAFHTVNGNFEWVPAPSQTGEFNMRFSVADNGTPPLSNTVVVTMNVQNPAPVLAMIAPGSVVAGAPATLVTITGSSFVPSSVVQWNGSPRTTSYIDATQLSALIPVTDLALGGIFNVSVSTPAPGGGTSGSQVFTVNNPIPVAGSLAPPSAPAGGGAFILTVNGAGFVPGSIVRWNGSARTTTFATAIELTASISAADIASAGTANVDVVNPAPGGGTSNILALTITDPAPGISSTSPTSATSGGPAFPLIVLGTNFFPDSIVRWEGNTRITAYNSPTQLTAQILASDIQNAGTFNLTVFNSGTSLLSPAFAFAVLNPSPVVSSLLPDNTPTGSADTIVSINGSGFVPGSVARWNGSPRTTNFLGSTSLAITILATDMSLGTVGDVSVVNPGPGGGISGNLGFSVINPTAPVLGSTTPPQGFVSSGDTAIQINGSGFVPNSVVRVAGSSRATNYVNTTTLSALFLASDFVASGTKFLTVFNPPPGGGTSNTFNFDVVNPFPVATSISPTEIAQYSGNFVLMVNGSGFAPTSVIRWNGADRITTFVNSGQLTANIPATDVQTMGSANITVFSPTPGGGTSLPPIAITIGNPVPSISNLAPPEVILGSGDTTVFVIGSGFTPSSVIRFNGVDRATLFSEETVIRTTVLASELAAVAAINVTVFNSAPAGGTSNTATFSIVNSLQVTTLVTPTTIVVGSPTQVINVTGTGFVPTTVGLWNGSLRATNVISDTSLEITIPASDLTTSGNGNLAVMCPTCGGGTSATTVISLVNSQPILTNTVPTSVERDTPAFVLAVMGSNFVNGIELLWNGSPRPTTFVSSTQFTAAIPLSDLATPTNVEISARNPVPALADGNTIGFTITGGFAPVGSEEFSTHWNVRGSLNTGRTMLTATRLQDGSVLIAGGRSLPGPGLLGTPLSSTELFDRATGEWHVAGSMNFSRVAHTATFIPFFDNLGSKVDGLVLVVGGDSGSSPAAARTAEVFSIRDRRWRVVNPPLFAHIGHTATRLPDGRILVAGGEDDSGNVTDNVEIYDPRSGQWTATSSMSIARAYHTTVLLDDGRIMVIGGRNLSRTLDSAEIFDPPNSSWTEVSSLTHARLGHTSSVLGDGRVLVAGGVAENAGSSVESFDPATGKWTATGSLLSPRSGHSATVLSDGRVLITGGKDSDGKALFECETFDPQLARWSSAVRLNYSREGHAAMVLDDGHILVVGGMSGPSNSRLELRSTSPRSRIQRQRFRHN